MAEPRIRRGDGYELQAGPELIDASVFQFLLGSAREQARPADAAARLEQALAVWRGPVLADVPPSAGVSAWAARLEQERIGAYERRLELSLDLGEVPVVADEAARLVRSYPLLEGLWRTLMTALYRSGRRAEALDAYQRAYRLLTEELGVEPGPQRRTAAADRRAGSVPAVPGRGGRAHTVRCGCGRGVVLQCRRRPPPADRAGRPVARTPRRDE